MSILLQNLSSAGGTLLYIANHIKYKIGSDLNIYKICELESTFIGIINPKKSNVVVGVMYRHPDMDVNNSNLLNNPLKNINQEQKKVFLLGNLNIDLMHYDEHKPTNQFLDSRASNSYLPYIFKYSQHTSHPRILIGKIYSNVISKDTFSGNVISTISDHLAHSSISPNIVADLTSNKTNVFERDWSIFEQDNFISDYFDIH